jgi:hypothetical protein
LAEGRPVEQQQAGENKVQGFHRARNLVMEDNHFSQKFPTGHAIHSSD